MRLLEQDVDWHTCNITVTHYPCVHSPHAAFITIPFIASQRLIETPQWVRGAVRNPGLCDKKYSKYELQTGPLISRVVDLLGPQCTFLYTFLSHLRKLRFHLLSSSVTAPVLRDPKVIDFSVIEKYKWTKLILGVCHTLYLWVPQAAVQSITGTSSLSS